MVRPTKYKKRFNFDKSLKEMDQKAYLGLKKSCEDGSPQALKLYYQMTNRLIEERRETITFEPSTTDFTKWGSQLIGQLRANWAENGGVCPVCERPKTLILESFKDTGQEYPPSDDKVAALEVSA